MATYHPREHLDLAGTWDLAFDPENRGKDSGWAEGSFPAQALAVSVPSVWNVARPGYEGVAFYRRVFRLPESFAGRRVRLLVEAANYFSEWWLNGHYGGAHEGGYTPFALDLTDLIAPGDNTLVARVLDPPVEGDIDGFRLADTACSKETWYYRYGGIWGDVCLEASSPTRCADIFLRPAGDRRAVLVEVILANASPSPVPVTLTVTVCTEDGNVLAQVDRDVVVGHGEVTVELSIELPDAERWTLDRPVTYRCQCLLSRSDDGATLDESAVPFGLRTCDLVEGRFYLNGEALVLKGVLYQPNYPRNLAYPPDPSCPERELRQIKDAGFNLVRFHIRPPGRRYLALCDRLGLLVYEETALAWISDGPHFRARCHAETKETILRDRNHPSVVIWGLFNENQAAAKAIGHDLLRYARALDPTRPIVDNSGGSASVLQNAGWCDETRVLPVGAAEPVPLNDLHLYFGAPVAPEVYRYLQDAGSPLGPGDSSAFGYGDRRTLAPLYPRLVSDGSLLVSEMGYGGLPDFAAVAALFGEKSDLLDARDVSAYRDSLAKGLAARGLDAALGDASGAVAAAQALQAQGDLRQVNALRSNPHVGGYVLTQYNDAAWECMAGIVDLWRRPKQALAAMKLANAPLRLIIALPRHTAWPGETLAAQITLVNEGLPLDRALLRAETLDAGGKLYARSERPLAGHHGIEVVRWRARLPLGVGPCTVRAVLFNGSGPMAVAEEVVTVLPRVDWTKLGRDERGLPALAKPDRRVSRVCGIEAVEPPPRGTVLVTRPAAMDAGAWSILGAWARRGGRLLVCPLEPKGAQALSSFGVLPIEVQAFPSIGCFMGWLHYVKRSPIFDDLPANCLAGEPYALVVPHYSLNELGGGVDAGAFTVAREADGTPGIGWWADVQRFPFGDGEVVFCQYRLIERLGKDPVADIMLRNLLLQP